LKKNGDVRHQDKIRTVQSSTFQVYTCILH